MQSSGLSISVKLSNPHLHRKPTLKDDVGSSSGGLCMKQVKSELQDILFIGEKQMSCCSNRVNVKTYTHSQTSI